MSEQAQPAPDAPRSARARGGWVHFGVSAGVLLAAAVSWNVVIRQLGIIFAKEPVPPPSIVEVQEHRLVNPPDTIGGRWILTQDGNRKLTSDVVDTLGAKNHKWNWYFSGLYRDKRTPGAYVQVDVTYYTGLLDAVPHVPDVCIISGGGRILPDKARNLKVSIPEATGRWNQIDVKRVAYEMRRSRGPAAQYYFFSMNGVPTADWKDVRWLMSWRAKYCFFAKLQVAPLQQGLGLDDADRVCTEFLRDAVPEMLKYLPSAEDVKKLEASHGSSG